MSESCGLYHVYYLLLSGVMVAPEQRRRKVLNKQSIGGANHCSHTIPCPSNALSPQKLPTALAPERVTVVLIGPTITLSRKNTWYKPQTLDLIYIHHGKPSKTIAKNLLSQYGVEFDHTACGADETLSQVIKFGPTSR